MRIRGQKDSNSQRNRKFAVGLFLLEGTDATPIKSHQHGCLRMSPRRMTPTDILRLMGAGRVGEQKVSVLHKEL